MKEIDTEKKIFLSLDAGASTLRQVVFDVSGETFLYKKIDKGANISINPEYTTKFIVDSMESFIFSHNCSFEDINHFSLGVAGISDDSSREMLFKRLDERNISDRTHLTSDINPVFEMNCSDNSAILVNVGTGSVCVGRDETGKLIKAGGLGLDKDLGSGYWLGKEVILNLSFSRDIDQDQNEFSELLNMLTTHFKVSEVSEFLDTVMTRDTRYSEISSIAAPLLTLAEDGNEIALTIVQQGSQFIADQIIYLADQIAYPNNELLIIANGGILNNSLYRNSLADALTFDFNVVNWLFPSLSTAYYPGLLSCKMLGISTDVKDIMKFNTYEKGPN